MGNEEPKSLEQREIEDAIAELQKSEECNQTEHRKVVKAAVLSIRMHEIGLYQNKKIIIAIEQLRGDVSGMNLELQKVSKMSKPEAAMEQRRDHPTVMNGGISFRGFKAWGLPSKILAYSLAAAILIVVTVGVINRMRPGPSSELAQPAKQKVILP